MTPDLGSELARHVNSSGFDALPESAVIAAKKSTLDILGVVLAGSGLDPAASRITKFAQAMGGVADSTVIGSPLRLPAPWAAFTNGALAHCLDFDDLTPWGNHATSSIIPAVLAVAQRQGGISGRDLITAVALGQDIFARLLCSVEWKKDWNMSTVAGVFAGAAAAGRAMRLSAEQLEHALSIACMQAAGTMEVIYGTGGDMRGMYAGFSAKAAVLSAMLAEAGLTGVKTTFDGRAGFFSTFFSGKYDRPGLLDDLGKKFTGGTTLYKPWPAVGPSHSHIHATIELFQSFNLADDDIAEIRIHVGDYQQVMSSPLDARRAPETLVDAKFSLPFLVATAAVHRSVKISHFTQAALKDERVLGMARKVVPVPDSEFDWRRELPMGRVVIVTADGRLLDRVGRNVPGSASSPLEWDEIARKFSECAGVAAHPPKAEAIAEVCARARRLEDEVDAMELLALLQPL